MRGQKSGLGTVKHPYYKGDYSCSSLIRNGVEMDVKGANKEGGMVTLLLLQQCDRH